MDIEYYGTDTKYSGHYFFNECGRSTKRRFSDLPFNPETVTDNKSENGTVVFTYTFGYTILAINGSCIDKRGGCKSVFFVRRNLTYSEMRSFIMDIDFYKSIIEKMPFEIKWPE